MFTFKHLPKIAFLVPLILSCATTQGTWDKSNQSKEPYVFDYQGTKMEMLRELKRLLVLNGFTLENEDSSAGILVTKPKILMDDEKIKADFAMAMAGASVGKQYGNISFLYETLGEGLLKLQMICRLQYDAKYHESAFKDRDISSAVDALPQGHPFPMKMRALLVQSGKFNLLQPK